MCSAIDRVSMSTRTMMGPSPTKKTEKFKEKSALGKITVKKDLKFCHFGYVVKLENQPGKISLSLVHTTLNHKVAL